MNKTESKISILYRLAKASYVLALLKGIFKYGKFGNDNLVVTKPADRKGDGLFTTAARKKGELVFIATGPTIYKHFNLDNTNESPNWYAVDKDTWIDIQEPFVKANHSCEPNLGIDGSRCFRALRNIQQNEELTFDYATADHVDGWIMKCECKTKSCSGFVGSIYTLPHDRFKQAYPYIPKYLLNLYRRTHNIK